MKKIFSMRHDKFTALDMSNIQKEEKYFAQQSKSKQMLLNMGTSFSIMLSTFSDTCSTNNP